MNNSYNKKEIKSVGNGTTSIIDINSLDQTKQLIYFLSEKVATRLRELNLAGSCISLSSKDDDLETVSHSTTISSPTNNTNTIAQVSVELLKKCWDFKTAKKNNKNVSFLPLFAANDGVMQKNLVFIVDLSHKCV